MQNCPSVVCSGLIFLARRLLLVWVLAPSVLAISPLIVVWNIVAHSHSQGSCGWKQWLLPACRSLSGSGSLCLPLYTMETHVDVFFRVKAGRSSYGDSALALHVPTKTVPCLSDGPGLIPNTCNPSAQPTPFLSHGLTSEAWAVAPKPCPHCKQASQAGECRAAVLNSILASTHWLLCSPLRLRSSPST